MNAKDFENAQILIPPTDLLKRFHSIVADMLDLQHCLQLSNANLRQTRDLLLPKLISGEISVEHVDCKAPALPV